MPNPFQHPAAEALLGRVASHFKEKTVWLLGRNQLVFVCGGPLAPGSLSLRKKFLEWAPANVAGFRFFRAEVAAKDLVTFDEPRFLNLAQFESVLADVADCVVLFPESVGSFAEIGYFSASERIRRKCLVVNSMTEQGTSFLNVGPIRTIDSFSSYQPTIFANWAAEPVDFTFVKERLQQFDSSKRRRLEISDFDSLTGHEQFAVLHYLISIFPSLDMASIVELFKTLFKKYRQERIRHLISILVAAGYVRRVPNDEFRIFTDFKHSPLLQVEGVSREGMLSEHLAFFEKYAPTLIPSAEVRNAG